MNKQVVIAFAVVVALMVAVGNAPSETDGSLKGLDIKKTGTHSPLSDRPGLSDADVVLRKLG